MFYLVCFDIVDDRTRNHAAGILEGCGRRVQKSVFECASLNERRFLKMKEQLESCIDHGEDTVRYYPICRDCLGKIEFSGIGSPPETSDYRVV